MLKKLLLLFAVSFFMIQSFGQFTFSVSPGLNLNSASFGYKINSKVIPYISLQHFNASFTSEYSRDRYDYDLNRVYRDVDVYEFKGSLYIPNVGVKYFAIQQNKLQAYFSVNFSKPIFTGKVELGDSDSDNEYEEELEDEIKNISFWGGEFGFGVEYFFDDNFSLGGEFGIRHLNFKYKDERDGSFYNPDTGLDQNTTIEESFGLSSSPTFSKITLNFYFNTKD